MKNVKYCLTVFFLLLITVPFLGRYCIKGSSSEKFLRTENRLVTQYIELESLRSRHFKKYFNNLNNYISDRLSKKDSVVKYANRLLMNPAYFLNLDLTKGTVGLDGYLFLGNLYEGVINRHFNKDYVVDKNKESALYSLHVELSSLAKDLNSKYYFFIAPDKHNVYCDKVPKWLTSNACAISNKVTDHLVSNLRERNLNVIYPLDDLRRLTLENVYYKSDTHWNVYGAEIGYKHLNGYINKESNLGLIINSDYTLESTEMNYVGDLINILGIAKERVPNDKVYSIETVDSVLWSNKTEQPRFVPLNQALAQGADPNWYGYMKNERAPNNRKVLVFCDSFMTSMSLFFNINFKEVFYYSRHRSKDDLKRLMLEIKPDIVIYESVERAVGA